MGKEGQAGSLIRRDRLAPRTSRLNTQQQKQQRNAPGQEKAPPFPAGLSILI
jgi:hypothetical protein